MVKHSPSYSDVTSAFYQFSLLGWGCCQITSVQVEGEEVGDSCGVLWESLYPKHMNFGLASCWDSTWDSDLSPASAVLKMPGCWGSVLLAPLTWEAKEGQQASGASLTHIPLSGSLPLDEERPEQQTWCLLFSKCVVLDILILGTSDKHQ